MGYTHYWYMEKDKEVEEGIWNKFTTDAKALIVDSPILEKAKIEYYSGDEAKWWNPPEIDEIKIRFEGGHETFYLERKNKQVSWREDQDLVFNFCKTNRKEYDGLVTATLLLAKHHLGERIDVNSDGGIDEWKNGAWDDVPSGYELVQTVISQKEANAALHSVFTERGNN